MRSVWSDTEQRIGYVLLMIGFVLILVFVGYEIDRVVTTDRIAEENAHAEQVAEMHSPCDRPVN